MNNLIGKNAVVVTPSDTAYITDAMAVQVTEPVKTITSVAVASDLFTLVGHGLNTNDIIMFNSLGTVTGINLTSNYWVIRIDADTFKITTTLSGTALDITGANTTAPTFTRLFKRTTLAAGGALFVGVGGDIVVLPEGHPDTDIATPASRGAVLFKNVPSGSFLPMSIKKVFATNTTATNILAIY